MAESAERQINRWLKEVDQAVSRFDKRDQKSLLRKGAALVRKDARAEVPVRKSKDGRTFLNPRYSNGKIVAFYVSGNLKKSIKTLTFRKSKDVFVGPRFTRKKLPVYGRTVSTADGYYAQMLYGSAKNFRARVLIPASRKNASKIRDIVLSEARKKIPQYL